MDHTHICTRKWWTLFQSSALAANLYGSRRLFLSPRPALTFCFRIVLKYSRLISRNVAYVKRWFGVAYLDEVCTFCSSVSLYGVNVAQNLPFSTSSRIVSQFLYRFTCSWLSINLWVIQGAVTFCDCFCSACSRRSHVPCFICKALLWDESSLA